MRWDTYEHMDVIGTCLRFDDFHFLFFTQLPQYLSDIRL